jgi:glycosyltransferase involved in cell wall biosynthesis
MDNLDFVNKQVKFMYGKYYDYLISSSVNYFVTASKYASNILKKNRSFENSKFDVIPNAVFPFSSKFKLHEYKSVINFGCVGLLTHRKGFNIAIEAVALLKNKYSFTDLPCSNTDIPFVCSQLDIVSWSAVNEIYNIIFNLRFYPIAR